MTSFYSGVDRETQQGVPGNIYLFKVNNRDTRIRCKIHSELTLQTPEQLQQRDSGGFIVNFEHISRLTEVFLLWTSRMHLFSGLNIFLYSNRFQIDLFTVHLFDNRICTTFNISTKELCTTRPSKRERMRKGGYLVHKLLATITIKVLLCLFGFFMIKLDH